MGQRLPAFVTINPRNGKVELKWGFETFVKYSGNGMFSCYIPSFDIYYAASSKEEVDRFGDAMVKGFVMHHVEHVKNGYKALALQLHKLGFRATNDAFIIRQITLNNLVDAKFKSTSSNIPEDFSDAEKQYQEAETEMAV